MAKFSWDTFEDKDFELGVSHGALYVDGFPAEPWSGLVSVTDSSNTEAPKPHYLDGVLYYNEPGIKNASFSIEAFTYPDVFSYCEGITYSPSGLGFDSQTQRSFGFSYRTEHNNDEYTIHLVYNALATPSSKKHETLSDRAQPLLFSWDVVTTPAIIQGHSPLSHFLIDSRKVSPYVLRQVESIIYGSESSSPRLLTPEELVKLFKDWEGLYISPNADTGLYGLDHQGPSDDVSGDYDEGLFKIAPTTTLVPSGTTGFYKKA